jgi:response regulator RpfG family c-di-GMP phosphodiesterase
VPAERTRGLDLGADDVLSLPVDRHELLARVRWQLRNKHAIDEFRQQERTAEENRNVAQRVVTAVNEEHRTLKVGGLVTLAVLIVAGHVMRTIGMPLRYTDLYQLGRNACPLTTTSKNCANALRDLATLGASVSEYMGRSLSLFRIPFQSANA